MAGNSVETKTIKISLKVAITSMLFVVVVVAAAMLWAITVQVKVERNVLDIDKLTKHALVTDMAVGEIKTGQAVLVAKLEAIIDSQRRIEAALNEHSTTRIPQKRQDEK